MGNCGECKYRGEPIIKTDWSNDDITEIDTGYFLCELIKHDKENRYPKNEGFIVQDGSGYIASLCVESDFGCIKWEKADG